MKPDLDYMSQLLQVFLDAENAYINLNDFKQSNVVIEEKIKTSLEDMHYIELPKERAIQHYLTSAPSRKEAEIMAEKKMEERKRKFDEDKKREEQKTKFTERFIFHINLFIDTRLLGTKKGVAYNLDNIGIDIAYDDNHGYCDVPIRLTSQGHDFAQSLTNKEVLQKLKTEFKDAPFKTLFDGGQALLQHVFKKKLDTILEE